MPANSQYIPLKNEYILQLRLNIYCIRLRIYTASANAVLLHFQLSRIDKLQDIHKTFTGI